MKMLSAIADIGSRARVTGVGGLALSLFAFAATADPVPVPVADTATGSAAGSFASLLVPLVLLAAAAIAATWFVTRSRGSLMKRGGPIRLVHVTGIGPRERLVVVEVDDRRYLLGVTPNRISTLADLGDRHDTPTNSTPPPLSQP